MDVCGVWVEFGVVVLECVVAVGCWFGELDCVVDKLAAVVEAEGHPLRMPLFLLPKRGKTRQVRGIDPSPGIRAKRLRLLRKLWYNSLRR